MSNLGLLTSLLEISTDENSTQELDDELNQYFVLLAGVIVESTTSIPPYTLGEHSYVLFTCLAFDEPFLLSLKCLINFTSNERLSQKLFKCLKSGIKDKFLLGLASFSFTDVDEDARILAISLLVNLTVISEWCSTFCEAVYAKSVYQKIAIKRQPPCIELRVY